MLLSEYMKSAWYNRVPTILKEIIDIDKSVNIAAKNERINPFTYVYQFDTDTACSDLCQKIILGFFDILSEIKRNDHHIVLEMGPDIEYLGPTFDKPVLRYRLKVYAYNLSMIKNNKVIIF